MIGKRLNHYRIVRRLGRGGMGEVFLAKDTKLGRNVALKVLPEEMACDSKHRERFRREAKAVAALNHANIVTIHSVEEAGGVCFLTMELVEGRTLGEMVPEGGLELEKFLEIAPALANALSAAHERGITHRDLKPANIMVSSEGQVKVLDFGLAKLRAQRAPPGGDEAPTEELTGAGQILGTVPYMSPEQVQGKRVDHRSDIFSLGAIFYEMATGEKPFRGESPADLIASILRERPGAVTDRKPDLPSRLGQIIERCMEKERERRYQAALDLRNDLEDLRVEVDSGSVLPSSSSGLALFNRPAVAVLPFTNMSGETDQEYFADGITEDIITALSHWRWFPVIARNSTLTYKGKAANIIQVGKELGARYVLEGSVRKAGSRVRITAQLIDATTGHHIWAQRYDRDLSDIFELQDEISEQIVASIEPELNRAEQQRALRTKPESLDAWDHCLRALSHQSRFTRTGHSEARCLLMKAIELDPTSSRALSMLAVWYYEDAMSGWADNPAQSFAESFRAASRALTLDDGDWLAHTMRGMGYLWTQRAYDLGIEEHERAIALNPSAPGSYHGLACLLDFSGRWAEAIPQLHTVMRLDPRYQHTYSAMADLALSHLMLREFEEGLTYAEKAIRALPSYVRAYQRLACCLGHMGRGEEARAAMKKLLQRQPDFSWAYVDATYPFKNPEDHEFFVAGLRKAGFTGS